MIMMIMPLLKIRGEFDLVPGLFPVSLTLINTLKFF